MDDYKDRLEYLRQELIGKDFILKDKDDKINELRLELMDYQNELIRISNKLKKIEEVINK